LESQLKEVVSEFQDIIEIIEISKKNDNDSKLSEAIEELNRIDFKFTKLGYAYGTIIARNYYAEYDALLFVWKEGKNFQFNDDNHSTIATSIKAELFRNGIYFDEILLNIKCTN